MHIPLPPRVRIGLWQTRKAIIHPAIHFNCGNTNDTGDDEKHLVPAVDVTLVSGLYTTGNEVSILAK